MTIQRAKGLEFPVVAAGSLAKQLSSPKQIDRELGPFYHRAAFEPPNRTTLEFKESLSSFFAQVLVALANTTGGRILLGVSDDGAVKDV